MIYRKNDNIIVIYSTQTIYNHININKTSIKGKAENPS